ncbi:MAG: ATP-binding protein [Fibrobacter sp.]|nr:ATP-binding protein [Fibrobacter sp.]
MIQRNFELLRLKQSIENNPVTAIVGPRQCGKTTLASLVGADHRFDLENPRDLVRMADPQLLLEKCKGLIVIDEVQEKPELFSLIRYLVDSIPDQKYILLGSASGALINGSSESLAGRIAYIELGGLRLSETGAQSIQTHWLRGGLPRSFTAKTDKISKNWLENYIATFLERDLPRLGMNIPSRSLRRFWIMLSHYHGQVFNASEIGRSMDMSDATARRYLDILEGALLVRVLRPWFNNTSKRLVKSPKIYLRDSGVFHSLQSIDTFENLQSHPKLGASWEGYALEEVARATGVPYQSLWFWAVHSGSELDLMWQHSGKNWGVEFKYSGSPIITQSMKIACEELELEHLWVVHAGEEKYSLAKNITALPLQMVGDEWEY